MRAHRRIRSLPQGARKALEQPLRRKRRCVGRFNLRTERRKRPRDGIVLHAGQHDAPARPDKAAHLLRSGGLVVDLDAHTVTVDGARVALTYKEFELLRLFLSHPGMAFTRDQLFQEVWGMDFCGETRTVDMHIRTLRQKLGPYGRRIETVRNVGYRMEATT